MTLSESKAPFDPGAAAAPGSGLFGLEHSLAQARVHVLPVPFDATTSYRKGAAAGPAAVARASHQVELYDAVYGRPYEAGIALVPADARIAGWNSEASELAQPIIHRGGRIEGEAALARGLARVNELGAQLNASVLASTAAVLDAGKLPIVLGGDHAVPFGAFQAAAERHPGFGILHFDAHCDLRRAYEGFEWSHASIFDNALRRLDGLEALLQVGIRDFSEEERERAQACEGRVHVLYDHELARRRLRGRDLRKLVRRAIAEHLPDEVWISFDVDALDPTLCPNTGTPVPGGLGWHEALMWLEELARSGKRVLGADLTEVAPAPAVPGASAAGETDGWDAIVGARLLYKLIGTALRAQS